jgi:hypothetical protein
MVARGVALSENDHQGIGCVVTILKKFKKFNAHLVINSPHLSEETGLPNEVFSIIERIKNHAVLFVEGKRAQDDMFMDISDMVEDNLHLSEYIPQAINEINNAQA